MQKNIDLLRRNTLEKPPQGLEIRNIGETIRKAAQSVVFNKSFQNDGQELFRKLERGAPLEPEIPLIIENVCFGSSEEMFI